ncbi:serine hydrolase [Bradyrhizobium liaoningense]
MGNTVSDSKVKAALAATVELYYRTNKIVGIIAGAFPAGTAGTSNYWLFAEGTMRGPNSTPPDRKTMWQLGSVTKTFTATLLAGAASEGRLALDTTVQSLAPSGAVIPAYSTYQGTTEIRLLDLATHTAGLPQDPPNVPAGGYTPSDMYRYLRGYALAVRPGEGWNYSNLGYGLLSNVLVNLDDLKGYGALFDELKRKGKFELPDTVLDPKPEQRTRLAWGYDATGARAPWRTVTWPAFDGSGALYSTIDDAMVWLSYNLGALSSPLDPPASCHSGCLLQGSSECHGARMAVLSARRRTGHVPGQRRIDQRLQQLCRLGPRAGSGGRDPLQQLGRVASNSWSGNAPDSHASPATGQVKPEDLSG